MLLLMMIGSLSEGIGILLLVPLLSLIGMDLGENSLGAIGQTIAGVVRWIGVDLTLGGLLSLFVLLIGARALLHHWELVTAAAIDQEFVLRLRERLYRSVVGSEWRLLARRRTADIAHALVDDLERVSIASTQLLRIVAQILVGLVYLALALVLSPVLSLVAALSGAGLLLVLRRWNRLARTAGADVSDASNAMYVTLHEHLAAMKLVKSYGAEDVNVAAFRAVLRRVGESYTTIVRHRSAFTALFAAGSAATLALLVYVAIEVLATEVTALLLLLFLFARLVPRFAALQDSFQLYLNVLPAFARVLELIDSCEADAEPKADRVELPRLSEGIRLNDVEFGYGTGAPAPVIRGLDLWVPARETTAIVGMSGAGKSTVADLVMGLLTPTAGQILVDGRQLEAGVLKAWRDQIGYVPQEPFLFHATVRENLLWARPGATEPELWDALRLAAAAGFVKALPQGLDTIVGDRGILISGGERQRMALARALLRKPALLLLDEATSSLDAHNERDVQAAISALRGQMTILIISHRLASIRNTDNIHVLDHGRVVESGTWESLMGRAGGRFREMCHAQGLVDSLAVPDSDASAPLVR
jgi:ATP-binding cassette subfamily C protein